VSTSVATFNQFTTSAQQDIEFFGNRAHSTRVHASPVLLYVTGGLAYTEVKLSGSITDPACFGFCGAASTTDYQTGWTDGGGLEYAFAPNWSAKVNICITIWEVSRRALICEPRVLSLHKASGSRGVSARL
jgi:opacity protein-like surface antigen